MHDSKTVYPEGCMRKTMMGSLKNILVHLEENERQYESMGIHDDGRMINKGWIECYKFIKMNYDLTEKTIEGSK